MTWTEKENMRKPKCKLTGTDGNVFSIIGLVSATLEKSNDPDKAEEFVEEAFKAKSYSEVLGVIVPKYVSVY